MSGLALRLTLAAAVVACALALPAAAGAAEPITTTVMTRNVYLGADLGPGTRAQNFQELVNAAGTILNEVDRNKFAVRAKGLANEIIGKAPQVVGMQEVALWRTQPCDKSPLPPSAKHVRYDFLQLLLAQLNKNGPKYHKAVVKPEFDFEIQANTDGNEDTSGPNCNFGSELNARLTMRDVIIVRNGVETSNPASGTFDTLIQVRPSGVPIDVTRGWTKLDVKLGPESFRFVNTHLESFDSAKTGNHTNKGTDVNRGKIRQAQAKELFAQGGPAAGDKRVILVGDLNSDKKTEVQVGDGLAYKALLAGGFKERSTDSPLSCCLNTSLLTLAGGGKASDFDHQVDHVMTNKANVSLLGSSVTGRKPANGFWDSDHAGVFSRLSLP